MGPCGPTSLEAVAYIAGAGDLCCIQYAVAVGIQALGDALTARGAGGASSFYLGHHQGFPAIGARRADCSRATWRACRACSAGRSGGTGRAGSARGSRSAGRSGGTDGARGSGSACRPRYSGKPCGAGGPRRACGTGGACGAGSTCRSCSAGRACVASGSLRALRGGGIATAQTAAGVMAYVAGGCGGCAWQPGQLHLSRGLYAQRRGVGCGVDDHAATRGGVRLMSAAPAGPVSRARTAVVARATGPAEVGAVADGQKGEGI